MPSKKPRKSRKQQKQAVHIEQPPEQVVRVMFPGLAKMQDELEAVGCKVTMKIGSVHIDVEEQSE